MECPADCPRPSGGPSAVPFYRPTRTKYVSGQTSIYTADYPLSLSGLSAIHLRQPTRDNNVSGTISNSTCGLSGHPWRTVRSSRIQSTRDGNVSGQNPKLYCGLSAPKWRTVRSSILRTPPETSSLDNFQLSTADCPLPYSGLSAVHSAKPPETTSSLDEIYLTGGLSAPPRQTVRDT